MSRVFTRLTTPEKGVVGEGKRALLLGGQWSLFLWGNIATVAGLQQTVQRVRPLRRVQRTG
jgi:hypothetical protein